MQLPRLSHLPVDCSVLLAAKLAVSGLVLISGFTWLSGDDVFRVLFASVWAQRPFFFTAEFGGASPLWLPLPFWLVGSLLKVWNDVWFVPIGVSLFFSLVGLYFVFRIGTLLYDRTTGLLSAALIGILPWHTWLSLSAVAEPLYHGFLLAAFFSFLQWLRTAERQPLWIASSSFLLAGMIRPEAWAVAGLYGLWIFVKPPSLHNQQIGWTERGGAAVLAVGFCPVWLGINYLYYGSPLHFLALNQEVIQSSQSGPMSTGIRLLQFPLVLFGTSPTLSLFLLCAVPWAWRQRSEITQAYLTIIGGVFGLLLLTAANGLGTGHAPQRYMIIFLALLSPCIAAFMLSLLKSKTLRSRLMYLALITFFSGNFILGFLYVDRNTYLVDAGRYLERLWSEHYLKPGHFVAAERSLHLLDGSFPTLSYLDKERLLTERAFLQLFSGHPSNFLDVDWTRNAETISFAHAGLAGLERHQVRLIVVQSPELADKIPVRYRLVCQIGPYLFFGERGFFPPCFAPTYPVPAQIQPFPLGELYQVDRYTLHPTTLPNAVLIWLRPFSPDAPPARVCIRAEGRAGSYEEILPVYVLQSEALLVFPLQTKLPAGTYRLRLTLLPSIDTDNQGEESSALLQEAVLGPVTLIASKRTAVKALLQMKRFEPQVLFRLFLTF